MCNRCEESLGEKSMRSELAMRCDMCRFSRSCKHYASDSAICNRTGGMYNSRNSPAGCYTSFEAKAGRGK